MARTVRRLRIEQKAAQLGLEFNDSIADNDLLAAIRKTNKDFLVAEDKRTPAEIERTLVRVALTCENPERRERGSEQIFLVINGRVIGQAMFYDSMADSWHFSEAVLDGLLGLMHPATRAVKSRTPTGSLSPDTNALPVFLGMKPDFTVRLLPTITDKELRSIKARQAVQTGESEELMGY